MKIDWDLIVFPFDDKHWQGKFAVGAGLLLAGMFVPFLFFLALPVSGYAFRIMQRTGRGEAPSLPEWEDWSELFMDGLRVVFVGAIYLLPVIALYGCVTAVWVAISFSTEMMMFDAPRAAMGPMMASMFGAYALTMVLFFLIILLALPLGVLAAAAISRLAATGSVSKALEFREVWGLVKRGFRNYALAYLIYLAVAIGAGVLSQIPVYTIILCFLAPFTRVVALFFTQLHFGALFGMAHYHTENPAPGVFKDTDPTIKTDPLLKKAAAPSAASAPAAASAPTAPPADVDEFGTDEVPAVDPADVSRPATNLVDAVKAADKGDATTDEIPAAPPPKKRPAVRRKKTDDEASAE